MIDVQYIEPFIDIKNVVNYHQFEFNEAKLVGLFGKQSQWKVTNAATLYLNL